MALGQIALGQQQALGQQEQLSAPLQASAKEIQAKETKTRDQSAKQERKAKESELKNDIQDILSSPSSSGQQTPDDYAVIMGIALRYLARREHSRLELRRKLDSRGATEELVKAVLAALVEEGSLSDKRFASEYVRSRIRRGFGPIRIRMDLIEKGISDQLAEEQLTQPAEFWQQLAAEVCAKKFAATKPAGEESADSLQRRWNRCARFLSQRGFPADLIYQTLEGRAVG